MKKHYAYKPENNQPQWRQLYLALCLLIGLFLSNTAYAVISASETANTLRMSAWTPETGNILDCYTKVVKIDSFLDYYDGDANDINSFTYSWTGPNGFTSNSKNISVTVGGEYRLLVRSESGAYSNSWITVYGGGFWDNSFAGSDKKLYSSNETVQLGGYAHGLNGTVHPNYTVSWEASNGGNIVSGANTLTPIVDAPGTYTITLTHYSGCTMQDSMVVTRAEDVLDARITNSVPRIDCAGNSIMLYSFVMLNSKQVTEGITYSWTGPNGYTSDAQDATVNETGTYTLEAKHMATGTTSTATINVTQLSFTQGSAGPDKKLTCGNPTVTLEGSASFGHPVWFASDGGNIVSGYNTLNPVVDAPGTYTLRLNHEKGCPTEYTVKVTREDDLTVSATGGKLEPTSNSVQLKGSSSAAGATYSWTGPNGFTSTEQNPTVKVAGEYTLTVTDPETGCSKEAQAVVTAAENALSASIWSNNTGGFDCNTTSADLKGTATLNGITVTEGVAFQWSGPNDFTANTKDTWANAPGTYTLLVTHIASGDTATASWTFAGPKLPVASAGPDKKLTSANSTVRLEGTMEVGDRVIWLASDGGNIVADWDKLNPLVDAPGTYTMIVSFYTSTCTARYTVKVTREDQPVIEAARVGHGGIQLRCSTSTPSIQGYAKVNGKATTENIAYNWLVPDGSTLATDIISVTVPGDYIFTVTDTVRKISDSLTVTVYAPVYPTGSAGPDKKLTCKDGTVTLQGSGNQDVQWFASDGGNIVSGSNTFTPVVDAPGTYTMRLYATLTACTFEDVVVVTREDELTVSATGGKLNNGNGTVQLKGNSTSENVTYSWAGPNGYTSNQQNPVVGEAGDYTLTVSNGQGCTATTTVTVEPSKGLALGQNDKDVRVYPNPVKDRAQIEFKLKNKENYVVNLYDLNGNLVRQLGAGTTKTGGPLSIVFDASNLSEGLYLVRIISTSETKTLQVIVKK